MTMETSDDDADEEEEPLDVLDLPQLYQRPSTSTLLSTLSDLHIAPPSWAASPSTTTRKPPINSAGIPAYLTKIIASPLAWLPSDEDRERVWSAAAQRLAERSGRTGMGDLTRTFSVPVSSSNNGTNDETINIEVHEPAMSEDNLGLKTWAASFLLAKRLPFLQSHLPPSVRGMKILELGSGTGLVGLAATALFPECQSVLLTDLPAIVPNLRQNIETNASRAEAAVLDWSDPGMVVSGTGELGVERHSFDLILVADPIYSPDHPRLLVDAISWHLSRMRDARVVIELPLREAYAAEREDLRERLVGLGLGCLDSGEESGYDDWGEAEVRCGWSVWRREERVS